MIESNRAKESQMKFRRLFFVLSTIPLLFFQLVFAAEIRLAWDPNSEADLAGYKVYYGTASGTYGPPINVGNVTTYILTGLTPGQIYFSAVTAVDKDNNESGFSNEVNGVATELTQTISGYVRTSGGAGISGVVMSGLSGNPSTSADGSYSGTVDYGWSGTVTPTKAGYNFSPSSQNYSNVTSNQTQNYTGTLQTFTVSGYVRTSGGAGISGVVMSGLSGNPSTAADGSYRGTVDYGWSGTVTPTKAGYTFSPSSQNYSNVTSNQTQNYTGTLQTFTVSDM